MMRLKREFWLGIALGVLVGGGGVFYGYRQWSSHSGEGRFLKGRSDEEPQWWLVSEDFSMAQVFDLPEARQVLEKPESVTLHRAGEGFSSYDHSFAVAGVTPSAEDVEILHTMLHSPNSYTGPSMCMFQPGALLRFQRGRHRVEVRVCLHCKDLIWSLDGEEKQGMMGLSEIGAGCLRRVLGRAFPGDPDFQ